MNCVLCRLAVLSMLLGLVGCGGPYYTLDGPREARTLVIHDGKEEIRIGLGTSLGGSLTGSAVNEDGTFRLEKNDAIIVGSVNALRVASVKRVSYKGKEISKGGMMGN